MGKNTFRNKMIGLITDIDKVKEKEDFKYSKFALRWFAIIIFTFVIGILGFVYIHEIFGSKLNVYLMALLIFSMTFSIYQSVRFFFMNKELDALKVKWLNPYISFLALFLTICFAVSSISLAYFAPENPLLMNLKATYLFVLMPLTVIHYSLLSTYYTSQVFLTINKVCEAKGKKPEDSF